MPIAHYNDNVRQTGRPELNRQHMRCRRFCALITLIVNNRCRAERAAARSCSAESKEPDSPRDNQTSGLRPQGDACTCCCRQRSASGRTCAERRRRWRAGPSACPGKHSPSPAGTPAAWLPPGAPATPHAPAHHIRSFMLAHAHGRPCMANHSKILCVCSLSRRKSHLLRIDMQKNLLCPELLCASDIILLGHNIMHSQVAKRPL